MRLRIASRNQRLHAVQEASVGPRLRRIPHHHTAKAGEGHAVVDDRAQGRQSSVTTSSTRRTSRHTKQNSDVGVGRGGRGPVVPGLKVEVVLRGGAGNVTLRAAVVVVELDPDCVHEDLVGAREEVAVCGVGEGTLWGGCEVPLLASGSRVGVHEGAELVAEGGNVRYGGFEVKVEAVDRCAAERSEGA